MSAHRQIDRICVAVLVCTLLLTVLFINGERLGLRPVVDGDAENSTDSAFFTRNDRDGDWDADGATLITLDGDRARVSGGGAYVYRGNVVIAQAGRYVVSGSLDDGSIVVSADSKAKVWILLNGAEITCSDNACLQIEQADKVFLTLAPGTENSMESGAVYAEDAAADGIGGVIFSRDDLTINGSGTLRVMAAYKHGIDVNDELVISGGSITVEAAQDGIHANDGLRIEEAELNVRSGDEGIRLQGEDALLYVSSGSIAIESGGDALSGEGDILLQGGSFDIRSAADGIHSAGSVSVTDGTFSIRAADDGIHADEAVSIAGGRLTVSECYEGIEALTIEVTGGEIEVYPSDDGFNANGGSGGFGPGMFRPGETASDDTEDTETWIHISGGSVTIVNEKARDADGLDSNGDILISGGTVRISLNASGSNNAIDYGSESGGVFEISGGDIVACGSSAMAENADDGGTQCSIFYNPGFTAQAGTTVTLRDASGAVLQSYTAPCSFSSVTLSTPALRFGETYTVVIGEKEEQITLDAINTESGTTSGFGGFGPPGGGRPGGMGEQAGEMPDFSDRPSPPDFGGEMPDFSDMPTPPDFDGEMPQRPDRERREAEPTAAPTAAKEVPAEAEGPQPVGADTGRLIGACALALLLGTVFAAKYRRK